MWWSTLPQGLTREGFSIPLMFVDGFRYSYGNKFDAQHCYLIKSGTASRRRYSSIETLPTFYLRLTSDTY